MLKTVGQVVARWKAGKTAAVKQWLRRCGNFTAVEDWKEAD